MLTKYVGLVAWFAPLWLTACLDPMVGGECAQGLVACGSRCVPMGACELDGGLDTSLLDGATGEVEMEAGIAVSLDAPPTLDLSEGIDEGYDEGTGPLDGIVGEVSARLDGARPPDTRDAIPPDTRDATPADTRDAPAPDTRDAPLPDTRDAPLPTPDTRDAPVPDTRDAPVPDTRDAFIPDTRDAFDLPSIDDVADASVPTLDAELDAGAAEGPCSHCTGTDDAGDGRDSDADSPHEGPDAHDASDTFEVQQPCPSPQALCNGTCVDLQSSQTNCGACGHSCAPWACLNGQCRSCPSPQKLCDGQCVDTSTNADNCGGCGQVCPSGACRFGTCKEDKAGHIVVIGHDFRTSHPSMDRLIGNAIFLRGSGDVNVVEYVGAANTTAVSNTHLAITSVSNQVHRTAHIASDATASASDLITQLKTADVFLIQSQSVATNAILMESGQAWSTVLDTFVHTGGIVVLLDGSYPTNSGTSLILASGSLVNVATVGTVDLGTCVVTAVTDALAVSVSATYPCLDNSVVFSGDGVHVVEEQGRPVVLHVAF